MKISQYIFLAFVFILLLFSITTFINFRLSKIVIENAEYYSRSTNIIRNSSRFQRNILTMVNGLRGYLLIGEKSFIESYDAANNENDSIIRELFSLLTDSAQTRLLKEIKQLNDRWKEEYTEPLKWAKIASGVKTGNLNVLNKIYKDKFASGDEKNIHTKIQEKFREIAAIEYGIRDFKKEKLSVSVNETTHLSFLLTIISVITALFVVSYLVKIISKRIAQMTSMANSIAGGNYNVNMVKSGNDELSSLAKSLNFMAHELSKNIFLIKQSNAELNQFAHIVSHDLKAPLRGIGNVISWIEEDHCEELPPKISEYLGLIKGRARRAENLIEGLLSYARIDKEEIEKETININVLIDEVLADLPTHENVKILVEQLPVIYSERLLLFQIFSNLISNAI
ncbi:MAG: CHASE3 domain-containing protein, partial [Ginsengibacter sp.]